MSSVLGESSSSVSAPNDNNTPAATSVSTIAGSSALPVPSVPPLPHHDQQPLCLSRPQYRKGRRLTAVKAYTISDESIYLLINGVPGLKLQRELKNLCQKYGTVLSLKRLEDYPVEPFTEAHLVKYNSVREARFAKKKLDGKNFFGGVFHVCYAPELESVDETRQKLEERRRAVLLTLHKQEREKKRMEAASEEEEGGGSVLCQYHPEDRLASAIKRVTNRLSYNKDPKYKGPEEIPLNLKNGTNTGHHQFNTLFNKGVENCDTLPSSDYCFNGSRVSNLDTRTFEEAPYSQNNVIYTTPPPVEYCTATTGTNSESGQQPCVSEASSRQTNNNQSSYSLANASSSSTYDETLKYDPAVSLLCEPSLESGSLPAAVGQQYASMSSDYEPGLGLTAGERYVASKVKNKRNGFSRKTTVKSFTIKPTKAYKRRKLEGTPAEKIQHDTGQSAPKTKFGYREVVRSLQQQQRSREGDAQLARLQQALQATLGAPTAPDKVRPAPDRPTAKMKLLTAGVKLV